MPAVAIPAAVQQYPSITRYPILAAAGVGPIPQPITEDVLEEAKSLQIEILSSPKSTIDERKGIIKLVDKMTASSLQLPPQTPPWAHQMMQAIQNIATDVAGLRTDVAVLRTDLEDIRDEATEQNDGIQEQLGQMNHSIEQTRIFQANNVLSSFDLPIQPVQPLHDVHGEIPPLPAGFDGSTLASIKRLSVADLNSALAAHGFQAPPGQRLSKDDKARLLYRLVGGLPSATRG